MRCVIVILLLSLLCACASGAKTTPATQASLGLVNYTTINNWYFELPNACVEVRNNTLATEKSATQQPTTTVTP